jgi:hypothetical protein
MSASDETYTSGEQKVLSEHAKCINREQNVLLQGTERFATATELTAAGDIYTYTTRNRTYCQIIMYFQRVQTVLQQGQNVLPECTERIATGKEEICQCT